MKSFEIDRNGFVLNHCLSKTHVHFLFSHNLSFLVPVDVWSPIIQRFGTVKFRVIVQRGKLLILGVV